MKFLVLIIGILLGMNESAIAKTYRRRTSEYDEFSCPRRCNEAYYPLCGVNKVGDTKVFTNDCYMSMENCNRLPQQVYYGTEDTDCPDFDEWINDDSEGRAIK